MLLSTDTQITDQALLEITQQENIDCVRSYVKELLSRHKYNFRIFEWTARVEDGKIVRKDKTLLGYYDFYPNNPSTTRNLTNLTDSHYYQERVEIMRSIGKLRNDQFIEFEVYDNLTGQSKFILPNSRVQSR